MNNPEKAGRYLVLVYDWVGFPKDKPQKPEWGIFHWSGKHWVRPQRYWDTGGLENFEVVRSSDLPG